MKIQLLPGGKDHLFSDVNDMRLVSVNKLDTGHDELAVRAILAHRLRRR